jgi:broad specificity phosphatase PhoE
MTARLILISHASTDAVRRSAFPADEPLDRRGKARAATLAGHLPSADRYWASPELRTRQTAEALQLKATAQSMLGDCDYGTWKGCSFSDVLAREPHAVSYWLRDPTAAPHGGESLASLMQRVAQWLDAEKAMHHRAILITHASIIRAAIVHAIEAAPQSFWRIDIAPLSMTRLSGANGRWNLTSAGANVVFSNSSPWEV